MTLLLGIRRRERDGAIGRLILPNDARQGASLSLWLVRHRIWTKSPELEGARQGDDR